MAKPTTLPSQALDNAADQAQSHLPTEIPSHFGDDAAFHFPPTTLPSQALDNAADRAQSHLPTEIPSTHLPTLPSEATDHMAQIGTSHLPDWLLTV
jgi:hypothetical protein